MWPDWNQVTRLLGKKARIDHKLDEIIERAFLNYTRRSILAMNARVFIYATSKTSMRERLEVVGKYFSRFYSKYAQDEEKYENIFPYDDVFSNLESRFYQCDYVPHLQVYLYYSGKAYFVPLLYEDDKPLDALQNEYVKRCSEALSTREFYHSSKWRNDTVTQLLLDRKEIVHQRYIIFENTKNFALHCLFNLKKGKFVGEWKWWKYLCFCCFEWEKELTKEAVTDAFNIFVGLMTSDSESLPINPLLLGREKNIPVPEGFFSIDFDESKEE